MPFLPSDVTVSQLHNLEASAVSQGTIEQYFAKHPASTRSVGDQAWAELKNLIEQRVREGLAGSVSNDDIDAIVDNELSRGGRAFPSAAR